MVQHPEIRNQHISFKSSSCRHHIALRAAWELDREAGSRAPGRFAAALLQEGRKEPPGEAEGLQSCCSPQGLGPCSPVCSRAPVPMALLHSAGWCQEGETGMC